jgi:hypothetical protein
MLGSGDRYLIKQFAGGQDPWFAAGDFRMKKPYYVVGITLSSFRM